MGGRCECAGKEEAGGFSDLIWGISGAVKWRGIVGMFVLEIGRRRVGTNVEADRLAGGSVLIGGEREMGRCEGAGDMCGHVEMFSVGVC